MNDLSWLLYLAGVSENLAVLCLVPGIVLCLGLVCYLGAEEPPPSWIVVVAIVLLVCAAILPSKTTVYLIAASEAGETVVQTETAEKAIGAINRYLDSIGVEAKEETTGE